MLQLPIHSGWYLEFCPTFGHVAQHPLLLTSALLMQFVNSLSLLINFALNLLLRTLERAHHSINMQRVIQLQSQIGVIAHLILHLNFLVTKLRAILLAPHFIVNLVVPLLLRRELFLSMRVPHRLKV